MSHNCGVGHANLQPPSEPASSFRHHSADTGNVTLRHAETRSLRRTCDRCYQQKLRCFGNKQPLSQCSRCRKAGLNCVYSARASRKIPVDSIHSQLDWQSFADSMASPPDDLAHIDGGLSRSTPTWSPDEFVAFASDLANNFIPSPDPGLAGLQPSGGDSSVGTYDFLPEFGTAEGSGRVSGLTSGYTNELVKTCQLLEDTLAGIVQNSYTDQGINGCPIGEVFGVFDAALKVLSTDSDATIGGRQKDQEPIKRCIQAKHASLAAQCYVTSVRLMSYLAEHLLRNLRDLAKSPAQSPAGTETTTTLGACPSVPTKHTSSNLTLGDLYYRLDPLGHALNSAVTMLRIGSKYLSGMERALALPVHLIATAEPFTTRPLRRMSDESSILTRKYPKLPLTARFVAVMWDDETAVTDANPVASFRRCYAEILDLTPRAGH
ncbi:hypothetical protein V500_02976 [Pseudogymnoascus sp. VKM F-4518 (FW-2643)]|nr:hypothetical protein V500_02976 [Pseudogymnoascus sp. VKM F-4518 (FW-2643)]